MKVAKTLAIAILVLIAVFIFDNWLGCIKIESVGATVAVAEEIPDIYDVQYVEPVVETIEEPVEPEVVDEPVYSVEYTPDYFEPEPVVEVVEEAPYYEEAYVEETYYSDSDGYSGVLTKEGGVNYYNGRRETWYSQRVLPGGGLDIPGRHVGSNGLIYDGDGYICVAADDLEYGTVVETSLGIAKVYDCGVGSDNAIDIYTDW